MSVDDAYDGDEKFAEICRDATAKSGRPTIPLPHDALFCRRHGEPFRPTWPKGYAQLVILTVDEVLGKDALLFASATRDGTLVPELVTAQLQARPACCRVKPERVLQLYRDAAIGTRARCRGCNRKAMGTTYRTMQGEVPHLCFECVVYRTVSTSS